MLTGLTHAALAVSDLKRSIAFYRDRLGFREADTRSPDWVMLAQGSTSLSLIPVLDPEKLESRIMRPPAHLGFTFASREQMEMANKRMSEMPVVGKSRVDAPKVHRDGSQGFYFRDPDGNESEAIWIPAKSMGISISKGDILLVAHGSSDKSWSAPIRKVAKNIEMICPEQSVELCFLELEEPAFEAALDRKLAANASARIRIVPVFFSNGGHVTRDLARMIETRQARFPKAKIQMTDALGEDSGAQEMLAVAAAQLLAGL